MPEFVVGPEEAGLRLDLYLVSQLPDLSRTAIARLIEEGNVLVSEKPTKPGYRLRAGDRIRVTIPPPRPTEIRPEEIPLEILYEDSDLMVINKPRGMVTHPAPGAYEGTLVNAILAHTRGELSGIGGVERPGIVHRLDKDTTGLIVVAKNDVAHRSLSHQIASRTAERRYLALVWGNPRFERAIVDAPIRRHPADRQRFMVSEQGEVSGARRAVTELQVRERFRIMALLEAKLETGRTHQIRVHCSYIGHPVVGDPVYGRRSLPKMDDPKLMELLSNLGGQALHAYSLAFNHPTTGARMEFTAPPPSDFEALLRYLREAYAS